jgi:hypothetical protein
MISSNSAYWSTDGTITTSLKFLAAARISEMPPMSIFSMIACSSAPEATVCSNG